MILASPLLATWFSVVSAFVSPGPSSTLEDATAWSADVGMPVAVRELVLDGPELVVIPVDFETPVIIRIDAVWPHGTAHRYDLEFYALEAGEHDLRQYLQRIDGTAADDLPPLLFTTTATLAPERLRPSRLEATSVREPPRYRRLVAATAITWVVGLLAIISLGWRRSRDQEVHETRAESLAERLQPLIEQAAQGTLARERLAELELSLVAWWRKRLGIDQGDPAVALQSLLDHEEAGPLLRGIEKWLHRPAGDEPEDVAKLLAPYRDLPADALDVDGSSGSRPPAPGIPADGADANERVARRI